MTLHFLAPGNAWFLPALAVAYLLWRHLRRPDFVAVTNLDWLLPVLVRPSRMRRLPLLLLAGALVFITLALMQPVLPFAEREVESTGLDIVIVLDLSASMQEVMDAPAREERPPSAPLQDMTMEPSGTTRLEATKEALRDFIARRGEDRIGLVVFSNHAYVVSPLTFDYEYLLHYLDRVDRDSLRGEGMTAIGDGIALANHLLDSQREGKHRGRVITVFTDGEHNIGRDPLDVIPESDAGGIRVHVVGVDLDREMRDKAVVQKLVGTVRAFGGGYFRADTEEELHAASNEIDAMEKGSLTARTYVHDVPVFYWFVFPAAFLILAALGLRAVPYFADFT